MVKINNLITTLSLGLLSLSDSSSAYNPLNKRYSNSTSSFVSSSASSCTPQVSTSVVSVYGPAYTGTPSDAYTVPTMEGEWTDGPVWSIYIPQDYYNFSSLSFDIDSVTGITEDESAFSFYTGDIGNFIYPGEIFTVTESSLIFDGRTQDPLLLIVYSPSYDSSLSLFALSATLDLDIIGAIQARDVESFELSQEITAPSSSSATTSSSSSSSAATSSTESTGATSTTESTGISSSLASSGTTAESTTTSNVSTDSNGSIVSSSASPLSTDFVYQTTVITITSCSDNKCSETTIEAMPSVVYTTVSETEVSYTTYCPISKDKPTEMVVMLTESTVTIDDVVTVITTYCPVTSSSLGSSSGSSSGSASTTGNGVTTVTGTGATAVTSTSGEFASTSATGEVVGTTVTGTNGETFVSTVTEAGSEVAVTTVVTSTGEEGTVVTTIVSTITVSSEESTGTSTSSNAAEETAVESLSTSSSSDTTTEDNVSIYSGAANAVKAGSGIAAIVAGFALML